MKTTTFERIQLVLGDITALPVDAIVNAANETLLGGGGVDGAIHRAAGPALRAECATLGGCRAGQAKLTGGYKLPAKHVIHTVGPRWRGGGRRETQILADCYRNSLDLAKHHGIRTIAFPSISTGAFGYPITEAAPIALRTTMKWLAGDTTVEFVTFICFAANDLEVYRQALDALRS